ncbi:MAG: SRPBCC family protein [Myxococcales bacterium]|nr:SRPBCC family protein [Myxococcales bacterium]
MQAFELVARIPAPPERVFDLLADHRGLAEWSGAREVVLRQEGDPPPNGLGAIRVVRGSGLAIEEEVTSYDPPRRMTYRISAGLPIRDHQGEVQVTPLEDASEVRWKVCFRPLVPGTGPLLRYLLRRGLEGVLARLTRYAF